MQWKEEKFVEGDKTSYWVTIIIDNNPPNIYLFKVDNRNTKKGVKYVQSEQQKHQNDTTGFEQVNFSLYQHESI